MVTHALQDGFGVGRSRTDLDRALVQVTDATWASAARLAAEVGASEAFAVSLTATLAARLSIERPARLSTDVARAAAGTRASGAPLIEAFRTATGLRARAGLVLE